VQSDYDLQTSIILFSLGGAAETCCGADSLRFDGSPRAGGGRELSLVTSRGSEIGGLLIGAATAGSPLVVSIAEYQLIDCEYSRGPCTV